MESYFQTMVIGQGSNDIFVRIGWCPDVVRITEWETGLGMEWYRLQGADIAITRVAAGDRTVQTAQGIKLVNFTADPMDMTADLTAFTDVNWNENGKDANGVQLTSDLTGLTDHGLLCFEAWRSSVPIIRAVHDGTTSSNTYFEDSSVDFRELGVSGGQLWLIYNFTNANYCYVGEVQKPSGKSKYCRLTSVLANGNATTAADFDTSDVVYVLPKSHAQYPLGDYGIMT